MSKIYSAIGNIAFCDYSGDFELTNRSPSLVLKPDYPDVIRIYDGKEYVKYRSYKADDIKKTKLNPIFGFYKRSDSKVVPIFVPEKIDNSFNSIIKTLYSTSVTSGVFDSNLLLKSADFAFVLDSVESNGMLIYQNKESDVSVISDQVKDSLWFNPATIMKLEKKGFYKRTLNQSNDPQISNACFAVACFNASQLISCWRCTDMNDFFVATASLFSGNHKPANALAVTLYEELTVRRRMTARQQIEFISQFQTADRLGMPSVKIVKLMRGTAQHYVVAVDGTIVHNTHSAWNAAGWSVTDVIDYPGLYYGDFETAVAAAKNLPVAEVEERVQAEVKPKHNVDNVQKDVTVDQKDQKKQVKRIKSKTVIKKSTGNLLGQFE